MTEERSKAVCFTGHRTPVFPDREERDGEHLGRIRERLLREVRSAVERGAVTFYAGGAQGFDLLAEEVVLEVRKECPDIRLILLRPSPELAPGGFGEAQSRFERVLEEADDILYAAERGRQPWLYHARNRLMVDSSSLVIAYLTGRSGGTYRCVKYAEKTGIPVVNLAEEPCMTLFELV